jgi:outer membrane protein assembly factor BamA
VRVRVTESAAATLKFGLGAGIETGRTETYTKGAALWRGVLAPLNRVDVEGRLGYAWLANGFSLLGFSGEALDAVEAQNDVIGSVKTALVTPQLAGSPYDLSTSVRFDAGIEPGYAYRNPGAEVSVSRQFGRWLRADLGYAVDVFFIPDDKLGGATGSSSLELPAQFSLGAVTWALRRDRRDDPLATRSGYLAQVEGKVSESVLVGDTSYLRMTPEFRYFRPLHRRLVLAARTKAGLLVELGGADVPRTERYYLGGGDSVRGFPQGRLGPNDYAEPSSVTAVTGAAVSYDPSCLSRPTVSERCSAVPVGGYASWLANLELRGEIGKRWLYGTLFVDGGGVGRGSADFVLAPDDEGTQWAVGGGLRLATPIGPLRFDLGYRLTDPASYAPLDRVSIFMAFGEAF